MISEHDSTSKIQVPSLTQSVEEQVDPENRSKFKCDVCQKGCQRKRDLKRHKQIHSGTRYPCRVCNQTFSGAGHRKRHIREIHKGTRIMPQPIEEADSSAENNTNHANISESRDGGMGLVHSFIVKIENDSEEEHSHEEEEEEV